MDTILILDFGGKILLDSAKQNQFPVPNLELFANTETIMKSSNKIKNMKTSDSAYFDLSGLNASNRAYAQIRRRLREYNIKKKNHRFKSNYIHHILKLIPPDVSVHQLKKYTLPLLSSFIVTDGHMTVRKKKELNVLEVGFSNKNIELVNAFKDLVYLTFNEIPSSTYISMDSTIRTVYVGTWHNKMIKEIKDFCYSNNKKSIKKLLQCDKKILIECLRIAMSCDGFITFYISKDNYGYKGRKYYNRVRSSIELGCKPLELRQDWEKIAGKLDLIFHIKEDRIKCTHFKSMEKFLHLGGFIPSTFIGKNSKFFENVEKNDVLETLINMKRSKLTNLRSIKKEENLLKNTVINSLKWRKY